MENLEKIKFDNTTYLCNTTPSSNFYNKSNLLVGTINTKNKGIRLYKSLLRFYESSSKLHSNKNIYLFLFVDDMDVSNGSTINVSIFGNDTEFNASNVNWSTFSKKSTSMHVNISVSTQSIGKYIKINITPIIKSLTSYTSTYNLIIEAAHSNSTNIIQFSSSNGENIPYLSVENNITDNYVNKTKSNKLKTNNHNVDNNFENDKNNASMKGFYTQIIDGINDQNLRLDSLEKSLTNIFSSSKTKINNQNDDELNNIVSDLNELTKSEILQLKNSVNYDIIQLKNSINNNVLDLKNSIESKITNKKNNETDLNDIIPSMLNEINQNFSNVNSNIAFLKDYIESIKNESNSISEGFLINSLNNLTLNLNELTKSGILQLKDSLNYDITELKNFIDNDVSNLKNSINTLNYNLLELSNRLSKLSDVMQNALGQPIDN